MGSISKADYCGFICRLCSRIEKNVILIFGPKGEEMQLSKMLKVCLPHSRLDDDDSLPQTLCLSCVAVIKQQYEYLQYIKERTGILLTNAECEW